MGIARSGHTATLLQDGRWRLLRCPQVGGRFALQDSEASVVVRELRQVGERDLPGNERVVPADVGLRASGPVLELDVQPHPELLEVAIQRPEVDPEFGRDGAGLIAARRSLTFCHRSISVKYL